MAEIDHRVVGMELAVGLFVRLLYPLDALHDVLRADILDVHRSGIAEQAEHGGMFAVPGVDLDAVLGFELTGEILHLFLGDAGFEYDNHSFFLSDGRSPCSKLRKGGAHFHEHRLKNHPCFLPPVRGALMNLYETCRHSKNSPSRKNS